ncbi:lactoylglutathione lyase [Serratia rhizosphaerae]|uniref:Lactoylglutathione lyase n=1 Tax=Serratia rhizosphaerae TaxID=2597702 RepID=A0ABX6GTK7_9GAMM|nr:lactoylglutathione lyase [Serratia rhizosphaerae]MEB6336830.1 lactoylglutathione lyase [Serratia rhizosphaerae]QHA89613.1 lactoylglutathione lyase [Serratia rhizosphaerae]
MPLNELLNLPGVAAQPESVTDGYVFNHTMIRVKDLTKALDFYTRVLGFTPVYKEDFAEAAFTIVYLARVPRDQIPQDDVQRKQWALSQPGILELTHNHGTENQPDFQYHNGNSEPRGFGHLCVTVPDVRAACERFEQMGVTFQKRLHEGRMNYVAFIKDPDDYWIEILQPTPLQA